MPCSGNNLLGELRRVNSDIRAKREEQSDLLDSLVTAYSPLIGHVVDTGYRQEVLLNVFRRDDRVFLEFKNDLVDVNCIGKIALLTVDPQ